jgi:hypothetical protein
VLRRPDTFADLVITAIKTATMPLLARISTLERRLETLPTPKDGEKGDPGVNGKDADESVILQIKASLAQVQSDMASVLSRPGVDAAAITADVAAKSGDMLRTLVQEVVTAAVGALPTPQDGTSVTVEEVEPLIAERVAAAVSALPPAKDGASVTVADVQPLITEAVAAASADVRAMVDQRLKEMVDEAVAVAVGALPTPKDGHSVTVEDLRPVIVGEVTKAIDARPKPKDGIGIVGVFVDRDGHLIQTMSDGSTKDVGLVVGRDVDMGAVNALVVKTLDAWPKPTNGKDGLGFDDLEALYDEHGRLSLKFQRGDQVKTFRVPGHVYREIYVATESYEQGDSVTLAGSTFIAQKSGVLGKPGECDDWKLSVKRGRDGKHGRDAVGPVSLRHG